MPNWMKKVPTFRCVNCGLFVFLGEITARNLGPRGRTVLQQWIPSLQHYTDEQLQKESVLCHECYRILRTFDDSDRAGSETRLFGHEQVCRGCGHSVFKKQFKSLETRPDKKYARILEEIVAASPKHLEHLKAVCIPCIKRMRRTLQAADEASAKMKDEDMEQVEEPEEQNDDQATQTEPQNKRRSLKQKEQETKALQKNHLVLSSYRRVRANRIGCAVVGCTEGERERERESETEAIRAPLLVRRRLLSNHRLYLPGETRLCHSHCQPNADLTPLLKRQLSNQFNAEQIADMLFLMKPFPPLNADDIQAMDQHLRRSWLGVTWEEFVAKTRENPSIPSRASAVRLCEQTCGECPEVLASLFQLPRQEIDEALRITKFLRQ